jgi:hypothetical protein
MSGWMWTPPPRLGRNGRRMRILGTLASSTSKLFADKNLSC